MTDIIDRLRKQAEESAQDRRVAEFGPGGGNPDAKAEQHIEWEAAEEIERLIRDKTTAFRVEVETYEKEVEKWKKIYLESIDWQPMETAPKDGREVLLKVEVRAGIPNKCLVGHHMEGGHCIDDHPPIDQGWYFWNGCMFDKAAKPIAWMALPKED